MVASIAMLLPAMASGQTANFNIIPQPQKVEVTQSAAPFILDQNTRISIAKGNLKNNANMLAQYIEQSTGLRPVVGKATKGGLTITLDIDKTINNAEGYTLKVDSKQIRICGATPAGVFYGIQTLRKSLPIVSGKAVKVEIPAVNITDAPRFAYRGTHLDVSRHFVPTDSIRTFIDMLALHNINRFHWHLTDDQGWRIEIKKYPLLTAVGSKRAQTVIGHNSGKYDGKPYGGFYTQNEIRDIVKYAADRYITIVPEIDLPGHMQAALAAYPDMGCTGGPYKVWEIWGVSDNVLCAGNDKTMKVIIRADRSGVFFGELASRNGSEVELKDARRIWCWYGAASLSQLAVSGLDQKKSRVCVPLKSILILDAIEVIPCTEEAIANLEGAPEWKA